MTEYIDLINNVLNSYLPQGDDPEKRLIDAMSYSLQASGKRIRPYLTLAFCKLCGGSVEDALPFACAVEMVHTYSLIHDDMPCMDNSMYRRGKESNHIVFGEDIALLAGDALHNLAFEIMLSDETIEAVGAVKAARASGILSASIGVSGMVGGQAIDLQYENKNAPLEILRHMNLKKTGALLKAACAIGCISADADDEKIHLSQVYGENIGLAFQIIDDILDKTSTTEILGKSAGSDESHNKSTYLSLLGEEKCREIVKDLTQKAIDAIKKFDNDFSDLEKLAFDLSVRKS